MGVQDGACVADEFGKCEISEELVPKVLRGESPDNTKVATPKKFEALVGRCEAACSGAWW